MYRRQKRYSTTFITVSGLKNSGDNADAKETEWASLAAKLAASGRTFDQVGKFTLKQAESVLKEQAEKFKNQARLQGCTFDEDNEPKDASSEDIAILMSMFGSK